jgi:hypothetical protein
VDSTASIDSWVRERLGEVECHRSRPDDADGAVRLHLLLLEVRSGAGAAGMARGPAFLELQLRHLLCWGGPATPDHEAQLVELAFAALEHPRRDLQLDLRGLAPEDWLSLQLRQRPCLVFESTLRRERSLEPAPRVRAAQLRGVPSGVVRGVVLGPADVPIAGAQVEVPAFGVTTTTDSQGRFQLPRMPLDGRGTAVQVRARGHSLQLSTDQLTRAEAQGSASQGGASLGPTDPNHSEPTWRIQFPGFEDRDDQ